MALITVLDTEGNPHLVHTSMFGQLAPSRPRPANPWPKVWRDFDARDTSETNDRTREDQ
jgi:hypothetical protein